MAWSFSWITIGLKNKKWSNEIYSRWKFILSKWCIYDNCSNTHFSQLRIFQLKNYGISSFVSILESCKYSPYFLKCYNERTKRTKYFQSHFNFIFCTYNCRIINRRYYIFFKQTIYAYWFLSFLKWNIYYLNFKCLYFFRFSF